MTSPLRVQGTAPTAVSPDVNFLDTGATTPTAQIGAVSGVSTNTLKSGAPGFTGSIGFTGSVGNTGFVGSASTVIGFTGGTAAIGGKGGNAYCYIISW